MLAQQPSRPVRDPQRLGRSLNGRDDHRDIVDHRRTTTAVQIAHRRYPARLIPVAPRNHRRTRNPHPASDFRVRHPLGSQQHDPRPLRQPRLHRRGTHLRTQPGLITGPKNKRSSNRHTSLSQSHTVKSLPTRNTSIRFPSLPRPRKFTAMQARFTRGSIVDTVGRELTHSALREFGRTPSRARRRIQIQVLRYSCRITSPGVG